MYRRSASNYPSLLGERSPAWEVVVSSVCKALAALGLAVTAQRPELESRHHGAKLSPTESVMDSPCL
jgi:hypothetical protein